MQNNFVSIHEKNLLGITRFIEKTHRMPSTIVVPQTHVMLDCYYNNEINDEEFQKFLLIERKLFELIASLIDKYLTLIAEKQLAGIDTEHSRRQLVNYCRLFEKNMRDINDTRHWLRYSAALTSVKCFEDLDKLAASIIGTIDNQTQEYYGNKFKKVIGSFDSIADSVEP